MLEDMPYGLRGHKKLVKGKSKLDSNKCFLQSKSGQWLEWTPGNSCERKISQQFQECLRPPLLQRYGRYNLTSCLSINLQVQVQVSLSYIRPALSAHRQSVSLSGVHA